MDRLKTAFDSVLAEDGLKMSTKAYLAKYTRRNHRRSMGFAAAAACLVLLLLSGWWVYFTPTAHISIDTDASLELGINRFDRVISATSSSADGQQIVDDLALVHLNYTDAVDRILTYDTVSELMTAGEILSVGIIAPEGAQSDRLLSNTRSCAAGNEDTHCYSADPETAAQARETGLSCAKYRALQELQAVDPSINAEDIQGMTMRQIWNWISELEQVPPDAPPAETPSEPNTEPPSPPETEPSTPGHHGQGNGNGHGHGKNGS